MTTKTTFTDQDMVEAFDRIARTPDGRIAYRYFQKVLTGFLADPDPSPSALSENNARRKFAAELMSLMNKGIEESAGSSSDARERPVVFVRSGPVSVSGRVDAREHIAQHDPELAAAAGRSRSR